MAEKTTGVICLCVMFGCIIVIWAAYGIADATSEDTFMCKKGLVFDFDMKHDLPGGGRLDPSGRVDSKFSLSPWSIGQRDCFWFSCAEERCALPALFSEAKDLCIDMAYWTDRYDDDCIWWNRYVTGTTALWSPRKDGTDPKCNTIPPSKPAMTSNDFIAMKSACCICGGGLIGRDYAGPAITPDSSIQPPPPVTVPEQHKGKTPTHLTQCRACWNEAVQRASVGKSEAEIKTIKENTRIHNNPRGGTLKCNEKMELEFDKRRDLLTPWIIAGSVLTVIILCCMAGVRWLFEVHIPKNSDAEFLGTNTPFLVKL
jgi:hypothetical protein